MSDAGLFSFAHLADSGFSINSNDNNDMTSSWHLTGFEVICIDFHISWGIGEGKLYNTSLLAPTSLVPGSFHFLLLNWDFYYPHLVPPNTELFSFSSAKLGSDTGLFFRWSLDWLCTEPFFWLCTELFFFSKIFIRFSNVTSNLSATSSFKLSSSNQHWEE